MINQKKKKLTEKTACDLMRKRAKNKYEKEEKDKSTAGHYVPMCTNGKTVVLKWQRIVVHSS